MPANDDTTVVVPVYAESTVIGGVIDDLVGHFGHIVVVDDGSPDESGRIAARHGATVVRHAMNFGQGAALQTGFEAALRRPGCQYIVTFDGDGQHLATDAVRMVERLRQGDVDVVLGTRGLGRGGTVPPLKRIVLQLAVRYMNALTGMKLTDAHNGLRAFTRNVAQTIDLQHNGMAYASEIISHFGRRQFRCTEVPVHILYTDYSRSKGQSLWNSVNILFDLVVKR